jgi:formylglycine-generating enzyme required for sulfatase activity
MNRRNFINRSLGFGMTSFVSAISLKKISSALHNTDFQLNEEWIDKYDIIPAPDNPKEWSEWRKSLRRWREAKQLQLKYDGTSYLSESFKWVSSDFSCCVVMICDSDFYDSIKNEYTITGLIGRGQREYGGYDSVVLWHAYPRIGLDDRNQFDFYRELPGGLTGLKKVVNRFHESGIKVFIDYNPWDRGTRKEPKTDIDVLIDLIKSIDADGIFLDTMKDAPDFREKLDEVKKGVVLEGEIALPLEHIQTHHMSWAQWFSDSNVPGVYRNKWFEHHHMQHAIDRWNSDKTPRLHAAWMNGSGMLIWENVFGQWLGWNERDKSLYRSMYAIQHRFSELFSGEEWRPLSEESLIKGVYVSSWGGDGIQLRTLINRNDSRVEGILFKIKADKGLRYFDLVKGNEIVPVMTDGWLTFEGCISKRGIGCFLSLASAKIDPDFGSFLAARRELNQLATDDTTTPIKNINIIKPPLITKPGAVPEEMVLVPAVSGTLTVEYRFREPGGYGNIQDHLHFASSHKLHSLCQFTRNIDLKSYAIDKTPVTNREFSDFVNASGYQPQVPENFLKHWINGHIPYGKEDHPVVYVGPEDARAYAEWAGKRLPTEEEWQFAAQGRYALEYPWGNEMESGRCNKNVNGETTSVREFPCGTSPFGCLDMCGNTWELTGNEYTDGRTRFVMLKGGSCYKAEGSEWYFDGGPQKNKFVAKMLLIWPGLDRCSTVGFRCAVDRY